MGRLANVCTAPLRVLSGRVSSHGSRREEKGADLAALLRRMLGTVLLFGAAACGGYHPCDGHKCGDACGKCLYGDCGSGVCDANGECRSFQYPDAPVCK